MLRLGERLPKVQRGLNKKCFSLTQIGLLVAYGLSQTYTSYVAGVSLKRGQTWKWDEEGEQQG